jgi:hypothetical protein
MTDVQTAPRTAGVLVEVYSVGKPGTVAHTVHNVGPVELSRVEIVRLLRSAADALDACTDEDW